MNRLRVTIEWDNRLGVTDLDLLKTNILEDIVGKSNVRNWNAACTVEEVIDLSELPQP